MSRGTNPAARLTPRRACPGSRPFDRICSVARPVTPPQYRKIRYGEIRFRMKPTFPRRGDVARALKTRRDQVSTFPGRCSSVTRDFGWDRPTISSVRVPRLVVPSKQVLEIKVLTCGGMIDQMSEQEASFLVSSLGLFRNVVHHGRATPRANVNLVRAYTDRDFYRGVSGTEDVLHLIAHADASRLQTGNGKSNVTASGFEERAKHGWITLPEVVVSTGCSFQSGSSGLRSTISWSRADNAERRITVWNACPPPSRTNCSNWSRCRSSASYCQRSISRTRLTVRLRSTTW
jgi:hypothetical protein